MFFKTYAANINVYRAVAAMLLFLSLESFSAVSAAPARDENGIMRNRKYVRAQLVHIPIQNRDSNRHVWSLLGCKYWRKKFNESKQEGASLYKKITFKFNGEIVK